MNKIPNVIRINTGEQEGVSKTIDDFFTETREFVVKNNGLQEKERSEFEIKSGELAYNLSDPITDDRVTYLSYKGMILAAVFEIRTESNFVQYTFFRNLGD